MVQTGISRRSTMSKIYLTFDDGPLAGTDDVVSILDESQVRGTLFLVGQEASRRDSLLQMARNSQHTQIANHSFTHANGHYKLYYSKPNDVLSGFNKATELLNVRTRPIPARLPGRNTWRLCGIRKTDGDSGPAAELLYANCYWLYGWDIEWNMKNQRPVETPQEMLDKVEASFSANKTMKSGKMIILMHDYMFRKSKGDKIKLQSFVDLLKNKKYDMEFIRDY